MKRKFLPFSLTLITIVLGALVLSFTSNRSDAEYTPRMSDEASLVYGIKPSEAYLTSIRNNQNTGLISPADLEKVQNQLTNFENSRADVTLDWHQLGPDNFGGRTRAILFDNRDAGAQTVYAAGVTGGIWKSMNVGTTWTKINTNTYNLFVSCMAQDANGNIYVGTGESFAAETMSGISEFGISGFMGQGIYKSTDGENFSLVQSTKPDYNNNESNWAFINELAIASNGTIYAAANSGLRYSADGGDTWSVAKDTAGTDLSMNAMDVQVSGDGALIACIDNMCYISPSGDANAFRMRSTGDSISLPAENVGRIEFAFSQSDPNIVYASVANSSGDLYGIYLSEDKGVTWRVVLPGSPSVVIFGGQGIYDNAITVFPENPYRILVGGINAWEGVKTQETGLYSWTGISTGLVPTFSPNYLHVDHHTYVFRPGTTNSFLIGTDGGVALGVSETDGYTFEQSNRNYFTSQFYSIGVSGRENFVTGGAQDNGTILITGDGNTQKQGEEIFPGDGVATVVSQINQNVLVVSEPANEQDFIYRSEDAGINYSTQFIGGLSLGVNAFYTPVALWESYNNPNSRDSVMYHAKQNIPGGTTIQVLSANSDQPFYYTLPQDMSLNTGDSMAIQDIVSSRLFIATFNKIYMTKELHNFGKTPEWFEISNFFSGFIGTPQSLGFSNDANHLWVGTQDGKLYRISNLALAYNYDRADVNSPECIVSTQEVPLTIPGTSDPITQVVTSIAVDPQNPENVMITLGNYGNGHYVLYSENALDEVPVFESRQGNLPAMPVYSSVIEMTDNNLGIIGTEHGIFVTENIKADNTVWTKADDKMGSVPVFQLFQQRANNAADTVTLVNGNEIIEIIFPGVNNFGIVYAATYGRGLFRCNTFRKPVGVEENVAEGKSEILPMEIYPNPVSEFTTFEFESNSSDLAEISIFDLSGKMVINSNQQVNKGLNKLNLNLGGLNAGSYVVRMVIGTDVYSHKIIAK